MNIPIYSVFLQYYMQTNYKWAIWAKTHQTSKRKI